MKSVIVHEPTGQVVDLAAGVGGEIFAWLESLQGSCHAINPILTCGGCHGSLYIRHDRSSRDRLHAVHHTIGACQSLVINRGMSDEHKREAEYHALAGEAAGYRSQLEYQTTGNTRVDVVVDGRIGFEVQRSGLTLPAARSRTTRSVDGGLDAVAWFTDRPVMPVWYGKVPSYATRMRSWSEMPRLGTVPAIGPQLIQAVRCTLGRCPDGKSRPCGKYHPKYESWPMLVDDLVGRLVNGDVVPALTGKFVRLISPADAGLYEAITGLPAAYGAMTQRVSAQREERVECTRPIRSGWFARPEDCEQLTFDLQPRRQVAIFAARRDHCDTPACVTPGRPYPHGFRCDQHKPRATTYLSTYQGDGTA